MDFYIGEQLRAIAWALHTMADLPKPRQNDDLAIDATDAFQRNLWPWVEEEDWCGEFSAISQPDGMPS